MPTKLRVLLTGIMLATPMLAQTTFASSYGTVAGRNQGYAIQQTSDGGYIAAGIRIDPATSAQSPWALKLDSGGSVTWQNSYFAAPFGQANSVRQTSDSGYILAGIVGTQAWAIKLDSSGDVVWNQAFGDGVTYAAFHSVLQTSDGGYIAAGYHGSSAWLVKLDSAGNAVWQTDYATSDGGSGGFASVALTSDGGYAAAGQLNAGALIVKVDGSGNVLWKKLLTDLYPTSASSIQPTSDGGYIVGGAFEFGSETVTDYRAAVMKLNSLGSLTWQKTFSIAGVSGIASAVQPTSDGGYVLLTSRSSSNGVYTTIVAKLDGIGGVTWQNGFKTGAGGTYASAIQPASDGGFAITGVAFAAQTPLGGLAVLKLNNLGQVANCRGITAPAPLSGTPFPSQSALPTLSSGNSSAPIGPVTISPSNTASATNNLCP